MEISCNDLNLFQDIQQSLQDLENSLGTKILRKSFGNANMQVVLQECGCAIQKTSVTNTIESNNCLEIQPGIYTGGWEHYRIIALNQKDVKRLFDTLSNFCNLEIISRRTVSRSVIDTFLISTNSLLGDLTRKQIQALTTALGAGYYRVPKKITTNEISKMIGQPRTTFEEHLRKAESKVMQAIIPYIHLQTKYD
jgi:predicted DNA binding protein